MLSGMARLCRASVAAVVCGALVSTASAGITTASFGSGENQLHIDFVTIPGSAGDGYGGQSAGDGFTTTNIAHDYRIGVYEITNDQWGKFVNINGTPTGDPAGGYDEEFYDWGTGTTHVPTNKVSWYEAAQFVNWLNTSTGHPPAYKFTGTQGNDNYTLDTWSTEEADNGTNLYRHKDAFYYLPTENEWVKAGYWNGTSLQTYATKAGDTLHQGDGTSGTGWNYREDDYATDPRGPWDVGSGSQELNGTYDIMGNVSEWMESPWSNAHSGTGSDRTLRGGAFSNNPDSVASSDRGDFGDPNIESFGYGFRVASEAPEPASLSLLAVGALVLIKRRR